MKNGNFEILCDILVDRIKDMELSLVAKDWTISSLEKQVKELEAVVAEKEAAAKGVD